MEYLIEYNEFEINEKVTWKQIKKYGFYALMAAILGYSVTPAKYKNDVIKNSIRRVFSNKLESFDKVELTDDMKVAIKNVISKVEHSKNISNKEEVIKRLNDVEIRHYENTFLFGDEDKDRMMYFFDSHKDKDYILIFDEMFYKISFTHELNHLVDHHKIDKVDVELSTLLKEPTKKLYVDFFKDCDKLNREELESILNDDDFFDYIPDKEYVSIGEIYYAISIVKKDYYFNDPEIYARLSSLRSFLVDKGYLDIEDDLDREVIEYLSGNMKELLSEHEDWSTEDIMTILSMFDFLIYLPIINYDKIDDINLIAMNNSQKSGDNYA